FMSFNDLLFEPSNKLLDSNLSKFIDQFSEMIVKIYEDFTTKLISLVSSKHQELCENLVWHLNLFLATLMYQNITEIVFVPYLFTLVNNFFKNSAIFFYRDDEYRILFDHLFIWCAETVLFTFLFEDWQKKVHSEPPSSVRLAFIELCKSLQNFKST
ncbi:MAG: hypothetical protein MHMPM18_004344, partial [Marteilia pararefringens]